MHAFAFMFIVLAVFATVDRSSERRLDSQRDMAKVVAAQMAYYHSQAMRQCGQATSTCPTGIIAVDTSRLQSSTNLDDVFMSATDGNTVVTYWRPRTGEVGDRAIGGRVNAALRDVTWQSVAAGPYVRDGGRISPNYFRHNDAGQLRTASPYRSFSPDFAGLNVPDNAPAIVSRLR